jgi:hypothetical protein
MRLFNKMEGLGDPSQKPEPKPRIQQTPTTFVGKPRKKVKVGVWLTEGGCCGVIETVLAPQHQRV